MLGAVPAVFTPGPPPAHMSSPGRPVARRVPAPSALPAAEAQPSRGDAGSQQTGADQGLGAKELLQAPVCPPECAAEVPVGAGPAAGALPVTQAEVTALSTLPPHSAITPAVKLPQATAVSEAGSGAKDAPMPPLLPSQQQHQRQQPAFDPRAAAVPLGQAPGRTKQAASMASHVSDERPRLQAAAGIAQSGSLHAPLLPARADPGGGKAPRGGARKSPEPDPTAREPALAAPAVGAMAVSREHSTAVGALELSEQAAARASAEAAEPADDCAQLASGLPPDVQQPAPPCAEAPAEGITAAQGADERSEAAEAATAPVALPAAVPQSAVSDAAVVGCPSGASPPSDGSGVAARAQRASGDTDGDTRLHDAGQADQRDGQSAAAKRHREVAAGESHPSLAAEERPLKRHDVAATSSTAGGTVDVAAAMSVLLQVSSLVYDSSSRSCELATLTLCLLHK